MKKRITFLFVQFMLLLLISSAASAQYYPPPITSQRVFSQQELDQMLAPIALYPDALLSQIMMASTYPPEVAQAAEWSRANPHMRGDQAVQAVAGYYWEPSVKSLVAFPEILATMASRMDWTSNLGDAFLAQQSQVMDTIQYLRRKAIAAGTLRSDNRIHVVSQGQIIVIQPAFQQTVYVPYYNPTVVYGSWWWPNNAPVYWDPWPGYYGPYGYNRGLVWGAGIPIGAGLFFGVFDWSHRHVYVRPHKRWEQWRSYDPKSRHEWRHEPTHRRGTPYRNEAVRRRFDQPSRVQEDRRDFRGRTSPATRPQGGDASRARLQTKPPAKPAVTQRQQPANVVTTPPASRSTPPARLSAPSAQQRTAPPTAGRTVRTEQRPTALEGVDRGNAERGSSARGRASSREARRNGRGAAPQSQARPAASSAVRSDSPSRGGRGGGRND